MPVDQKRINGPEASHSYKLYSKEYLVALENQLARTDRGNEEPRKICKSSPLNFNASNLFHIFQLSKVASYPMPVDPLISS